MSDDPINFGIVDWKVVNIFDDGIKGCEGDRGLVGAKVFLFRVSHANAMRDGGGLA